MPLTEERWLKEKEMMAANFAEFQSFVEPPWFGFQGFLRGPRTGRLYQVVIEGHGQKYPQQKPAVYLSPQIGRHWVTPEFYGWSGRPKQPQLCLDSLDWKPARSSFANMLVRVVGYVGRFDA